MAKYQVKIKYGNPGEYKHDSQTITVEAGSELTVMQLARVEWNREYSRLPPDGFGLHAAQYAGTPLRPPALTLHQKSSWEIGVRSCNQASNLIMEAGSRTARWRF